MKSIALIMVFLLTAVASFAQLRDRPDSTKKLMLVEIACGQCQLGLKGKSCDLAVRFNGKSYFVDGSGIDDHGDAHAEDGFCNSIRKAEAQGEMIDERFKLSYLKLLNKSTAKGQ